MLAKLNTFSLLGIEALPVEVEVDVSPGALPKTILVGLPEAAVKAVGAVGDTQLLAFGVALPPHRRATEIGSAAPMGACAVSTVVLSCQEPIVG
jgi:hypothetical protein